MTFPKNYKATTWNDISWSKQLYVQFSTYYLPTNALIPNIHLCHSFNALDVLYFLSGAESALIHPPRPPPSTTINTPRLYRSVNHLVFHNLVVYLPICSLSAMSLSKSL